MEINWSGTSISDLINNVPALYQLSYLAVYWRSPIISKYLCLGVSVRTHNITIGCRVARDHTQVYDTTRWLSY